MKKLLSILLILALCLPVLVACGSAPAPAEEPALDEAVAAIDAAIGNADTLVAVDADYVKGSMKMDVSGFAGWTVKINAYGANIDEYGVFRAADAAQAAEIKAAVEAYLQMREDTWMPEYMPEERPKLDAAEIVTNGTYVCYFILGDEAMDAAETAFNELFA